MADCFLDNCQKKEWLRLRKLRFQQVRDLSKDVAEEVRRRTKEKETKKNNALRVKKRRIFDEYKKMKCEELEQKYNEAMEKLGLAHAVAHTEPDAERVLEQRQALFNEMAARRGKVAERKQTAMIQDAKEKENAPIRRKELTRCVEDIRAGLVVQCRDWAVINDANRQRQVLLDIPITNVQDFHPKQPKDPLPKISSHPYPIPDAKSPRTSRLSKPCSVFESKSPETTKQSPIVPRLSSNLFSSRSGLSPERPLLEFYERSQRGETYRVEPPQITKELIPSSDDEELSLLLKKYTSLKPNIKTPPKSQRVKLTGYTPPTREHDYSPKEAHKRKSQERSKKGSRNETKKLFKAIDRALEEGRKLQEEVSKNGSSIHLSDSESDDEAVVQLIVNVNCGQKCGDEKCSEVKSIKSEDKSFQAVEKISVGTEVGQSLDESEKPKKRVKRRVPLRTSTVEDLSKEASDVDLSSINDASQYFDVASNRSGNSVKKVGQQSAATWSSTGYFNLPEGTREDEASFKLNPFLDYYIRKLLGMPPNPCESSVCTECRSNPSSHKSVTSPEEINYDEESEKRLKKISELKKILQQIRKDQEALQFSSTTISPESSEIRMIHDSTEINSSSGSGSKESTVKETSSNVKHSKAVELPCQLSTITEVDSKLQLSEPKDLMNELVRRNIVKQPFNWNEGVILEDFIEKEDTLDETNISASTISSYNPNVTRIGDDWVPAETTLGRVDSLSDSSLDFDFKQTIHKK